MPRERGKVLNAFLHSENMYIYCVPEPSQALMRKILFICSSSQLSGENQLIHYYSMISAVTKLGIKGCNSTKEGKVNLV